MLGHTCLNVSSEAWYLMLMLCKVMWTCNELMYELQLQMVNEILSTSLVQWLGAQEGTENVLDDVERWEAASEQLPGVLSFGKEFKGMQGFNFVGRSFMFMRGSRCHDVTESML